MTELMRFCCNSEIPIAPNVGFVKSMDHGAYNGGAVPDLASIVL